MKLIPAAVGIMIFAVSPVAHAEESGPPEIMDWNPNRAVPVGYERVERVRGNLIIAGATVWGSLYAISLLATAAASGDGNTSCLWFPGFGPFIQLASSSDDGGVKMALALDGFGQVAGMTLLLVGMTTTKTVLVRNDRAEVRVAPIVTREAHGLGLAGTF